MLRDSKDFKEAEENEGTGIFIKAGKKSWLDQGTRGKNEAQARQTGLTKDMAGDRSCYRAGMVLRSNLASLCRRNVTGKPKLGQRGWLLLHHLPLSSTRGSSFSPNDRETSIVTALKN